jgi:predicted PurR-regulated permease PerM
VGPDRGADASDVAATAGADDGVRTARPDRVRVELTWQSAIRAVVVVVAAILLIGLIQRLQTLIALLAISLFAALAIEPLVRRIRARTGWPRGAAVGIVYASSVLFVLFLIAIVLPSAVRLAEVVADDAGQWLRELNAWSSGRLGVPLTGAEDAAGSVGSTAGTAADFGRRALGIVAAGASLVFTLSTIALFTFYLSADMPRLQRSILTLFRPAAQERVVWIWDQAIMQTGAYFYTRLILMAINGVGFLITLIVVGVPVGLSVGLSFFAGFVSVFIPAVGTYIGAALPILAALALRGLGSSLVVLGYAVVYQQIENYILVPRLSAGTMSLHGGIAFGAVIVGGTLAGPLGAFVSLPVAALVVSLVSNYGRSFEVVSTSTFDAAPAGTED